MWRINWKSRITGKTGHGKPLFKKSIADSWATYLNSPHTKHWVENCKDEHRRTYEKKFDPQSCKCRVCGRAVECYERGNK